MGVHRTYFSKNNTIFNGKYVNTGMNPVTELYYGKPTGEFSRYIFKFDISDVKRVMASHIIPNNGTVRHVLKMTNTLLYDKQALLNRTNDNKDHAESFELRLFTVPQQWAEGSGYDYADETNILDVNGKIVEIPSNWYQANTVNNWLEPGIFSGTTSPLYNQIGIQQFDLGNEDIEIDITDFFNTLVSGGTANFHGLCLAYTEEYENMKTPNLNSVGFFTKHTNTFFEPFVETTWKEFIQDDRDNFMFDKVNKLYLYTHIQGNPVNLDSLPSSVVIEDHNSNLVNIITSGITQESKGIYSVEVEIDSTLYPNINLVNFSDTWQGLYIMNRPIGAANLEFTVRENTYFNIGEKCYEPTEYSFNFSGLRRGEKISRGEIRKVIVNVKKMFEDYTLSIDGLYYRMYIKQGRNQIDIIKSELINRAYNQNYFYLNTGWMDPQEYYIELTITSNDTTIRKDDISFTIIDSYRGNINYGI